MPGKYLIPSILVIATLLIACAPQGENGVENQVARSRSSPKAITTAHPENFPRFLLRIVQ